VSFCLPLFVEAPGGTRGRVERWLTVRYAGALFRLVIMTFNVWFFTAIILGIGCGELLFGRYGRGMVSQEEERDL